MRPSASIPPFCGYTFALLIGILAEYRWDLALVTWGLLAGFGWVLGYMAFYYHRNGVMLGFSIVFFAFGGGLLSARNQQQIGFRKPSPAVWKRHVIQAEGILIKRISHQTNGVVFHTQLTRWSKNFKRSWKSTNEIIRLTIRTTPQSKGQRATLTRTLRVGAHIRMRVRLRLPEWYANPGLSNWKEYLQKEGIRWLGSSQEREVTRILHPIHASWSRTIDEHRARIYHWLVRETGNKQSSAIIRALVLGEKKGISQKIRKQFAKTGVSHLLAISGLHLAIVAHLCMLIFGFAYRRSKRLLLVGTHQKWAVLSTAPIILAYVSLSGASPSAMRAALMLMIVSGGLLFARNVSAWNTLALAAWILLIQEPMMLFQLSFQLSFLAVFVLLTMHTSSKNHDLPRWKKMAHQCISIMKASVWATLGTLPLVLAFSEQLPLWSPLVNLIAVPLGGYMVVGTALVATGLSYIWEPLATWILQLSVWMAERLLEFIQFSSQLPGNIDIPPLRTFELVAYFGGLAAALIWRQNRRWSYTLWLFAFLMLGVSQKERWFPERHPMLEMHFLDVGQGDATWIRFPNGQTMMIDAGGHGFGSFDIGKRVLRPYFRWMRVKHIDFAVLSHPHPDHFDGFRALFSHLSIGQFWYTGQQQGHPKYKTLLSIIHKKKIPTRTFSKPTTIRIGGVKIQILHPFPKKNEGDTYFWSLHANDNSLVMLMEYKSIRILFTGDIEKRGEEILLQNYRHLHVDVLKVPHHGSKTSSTDRLLRQLNPRHAVVSLGRNNRFGFPHPQVLQRYKRRKIKLWRTDQSGRIVLKTDGRVLLFEKYLKETAR